MGNIQSVAKQFTRLGASVTVSSRAEDISVADKLVLPGVGHFQKAMANLLAFKLVDSIQAHATVAKKPVLGICLGFQLLAKHSAEGNVPGLALIDAEVHRFQVSDTRLYKVPHMGWNFVKQIKTNRLMKGISNSTEFFFAHSYVLQLENRHVASGISHYENDFVSAIEHENVFGVQFHPEKSHDAGFELLKNFLDV
jgi:imidazole glycerol-phosphate synthase subunit HisH